MTPPVSPTDLLHRIEADLRGNILPFWIECAVNRPARTFHGLLTNDLTVDPAAERGALLTTRKAVEQRLALIRANRALSG